MLAQIAFFALNWICLRFFLGQFFILDEIWGVGKLILFVLEDFFRDKFDYF